MTAWGFGRRICPTRARRQRHRILDRVRGRAGQYGRIHSTCMDWSQDPLSFFFYTQNPGPGYAHCGGSTGAGRPLQPAGSKQLPHHTLPLYLGWAEDVHLFPKHRPHAQVDGIGSEQQQGHLLPRGGSPVVHCPVPDSFFVAGATWRAVTRRTTPSGIRSRPAPSRTPTRTGCQPAR